jgi:hypothetical protein
VSGEALPVIASGDEVKQHVSTYVTVEGVYEQQDVRMMQVDPDQLFEGHAAVILGDGTPVYLYPPQKPEARRSAAERKRFEHRRVRATGLLYANIPGPGAAIRAPCLGDISTIEPAPD